MPRPIAPEIEHHYGPDVHLLDDPLARTLLARLSQKGTTQPEVGRLVRELYGMLARAMLRHELPLEAIEVETRMIDKTPLGVWRGEGIARATRAVVVAVARAGLVPSEVVFERLLAVLAPEGVREDHLLLSRETDASGRVTGAAIGGVKIGGSVDGSIVVVPDPMGATGSTLLRVLDHYRENHGRAKRWIALNLIVTPEYLRALRDAGAGVVVYAFRLDRGLSPADVLASTPGKRWDEERGLDESHYIVPGAGGVGEVLTNSWV